jgi:hypothetical protein
MASFVNYRPTPTRQRRYIALIGVIVVTLLLALPVLTYPLGRDQGEFAVIGRGLLQGRVPYVDLWNPKPPAVFLVYAAAMSVFGQTAAGLRVLDLLIAPVLLGSVAVVGNRLFNYRVALFAAILFGVFYFTETFWTLTQNDGIALLPMCLAMVCALEAASASRRRWLWALGAGVMMGATFWFKYPFALFALALISGYLLQYGAGAGARPPLPDSLRAVAWRFLPPFALGTAAVLLAGALWLVSIGAWDAFVESVRLTAGYTTFGLEPTLTLTTTYAFRWSHWGLLFILAALGILGLFIAPRIRAALADTQNSVLHTQHSALTEHTSLVLPYLFLLVWLVVAFLIMLVQLRGYDYHWLPLLPPLALLGAVGLVRLLNLLILVLELPRSMSRWLDANIAFALFVILAASTYPRSLAYLTGQQDRARYYDQFVTGAASEFVAGDTQRVVEYLRARVEPGDSLYIWGFRPEVYFLSALQPPTRFIFQFPLVAPWYPASWREENVDVLWAALPPYVLVTQVDYMPWVTGSDDDSNTLLQAYTDLNDWLIYNYERDNQIGNFFVWKRKLQPG